MGVFLSHKRGEHLDDLTGTIFEAKLWMGPWFGIAYRHSRRRENKMIGTRASQCARTNERTGEQGIKGHRCDFPWYFARLEEMNLKMSSMPAKQQIIRNNCQCETLQFKNRNLTSEHIGTYSSTRDRSFFVLESLDGHVFPVLSNSPFPPHGIGRQLSTCKGMASLKTEWSAGAAAGIENACGACAKYLTG